MLAREYPSWQRCIDQREARMEILLKVVLEPLVGADDQYAVWRKQKLPTSETEGESSFLEAVKLIPLTTFKRPKRYHLR